MGRPPVWGLSLAGGGRQAALHVFMRGKADAAGLKLWRALRGDGQVRNKEAAVMV